MENFSLGDFSLNLYYYSDDDDDDEDQTTRLNQYNKKKKFPLLSLIAID